MAKILPAKDGLFVVVGGHAHSIRKPSPNYFGSKATYFLIRTQKVGRWECLIGARIVEVDYTDVVAAW